MTFKKIFGAALLASTALCEPALALPQGTPQPPPSYYYHAVNQGGMVIGNSYDSAPAFTAACAAAAANNQTLFIPGGQFGFYSTPECDANVTMTPDTILQAMTPGMTAVVNIGSTTTLVKDKRWENGVFDAHNNAVDGVSIKYAYHLDMLNPYVSNQTGKAFNIGDAGTATSSYEIFLFNAHVHRANGYWDSGLSCTVPSGSVGVYWGNVTDSRFLKGEIVSQDIGNYATKSSLVIDTVHAWPRASCGKMSVGFKDSAVGNVYINDHADTPSQYGWWFNSTTPYSTLISPRFTMNDTTITNAIGVYYSQTAYPSATIKDPIFGDASSGGHFATDFQTTIGPGLGLGEISGAKYSPTTSVNGSKFMTKNVMPGFSPTCVHGASQTIVLYGSVSSTWTVPACFTSLTKVEVVGAGGNVAAGNSIGASGGGAYASITSDANFVAGAVLNFQLGAPGGTQGTGSGASGTADTWFDTNTTVLAQGGQSSTTGTGGLGGSSTYGVGTVKFDGGAGGASFSGGGGGGSAGGPVGAGCAGGAGGSSKGAGGAGSPGSAGACSAGGSPTTGIGGSAGTGGAIGGQGWQSTSVLATYGVMGSMWNITTYGGLYGLGSGGGGGGGGSGQAAGGGGPCGGGAGGSGTLGSGTTVRNGGYGCIIITYVQ